MDQGANRIEGYDDYQIYLLLSCAPVQGHVAGIVDVRIAKSDRVNFTYQTTDSKLLHDHGLANGHL